THPDLAVSLNNLGLVLWDLGRLDEARRRLDEALALRRRALPAQHPDVAVSLSNRGLLLHAQGQAAAAWRDLEQAGAAWGDFAAQVTAGSAERGHAAFLAHRRWQLEVLLSLAAHTADLSEDQGRGLLARLLDGKAVSTAALIERHGAVVLGKDADALA